MSTLFSLQAISPLDGRYAAKLSSYRDLFSEFGLIHARVTVEVEWLLCLLQAPDFNTPKTLSNVEKINLKLLVDNFSLEDAQAIKDIEKTTNHDVKAVEYFIAQHLKKMNLEWCVPFLHFAATSEDINNLSYALIMQKARRTLLDDIEHLYQRLLKLALQLSDTPMLCRTHGQPASPSTMGKEIAVWVARLHRQTQQLQQQTFYGKFNGAVGNFNAHVVAYPKLDWQTLTHKFINGMGLTQQTFTTQIEPHDYVAEFCNNCSRINCILLDISKDFWGYIGLNYFTQKNNKDEVGSSTMPHKVNPIDFENAEGNLGLSNAVLHHLAEKLCVSRFQRDLSDSTALRNLGVGIAYMALSINSLTKGLGKMRINAPLLARDLDQAWSVLAEPIQTVMRKHGIKDAYEQLKQLTRGQTINQKAMNAFIETLTIPETDKQQLLQLTPARYIGLASELTKKLSPSIFS